jgi:TRAP-type transport system periplasmic protein
MRLPLTATAAALLFAHGASAQQLIFNTYLPPFDSVRKVLVEDFATRISQESAGAIRISIPAVSLAPSTRQWDIVTSRVADIAVVPIYTQRSRIVLPLLADLPFNSASARSASLALWRTQQLYFSKLDEFRGVQLLGMFVLPPSRFVSRLRPVKSIADFRGLKTWAPASELSRSIAALGGAPVYSTLGQLFEYASKGTVDALMTSPSAVKQAHIGNYVRYLTEVPGGFGSVSFAVVINSAAWSELGPKGQAALLRAAEGLPERVGAALDQRDRDGLAELPLEINRTSPALTTQITALLAFQESEWRAAARSRGLQDPVVALAYYRAQMRAAAAGDAH